MSQNAHGTRTIGTPRQYPGSQETRVKLLAAAERLLVERGITGLSVRKVGDAAGLNPTLVTYHFGGFGAMMEELCQLNMQPILEEWRKVDAETELDAILTAWLTPMLMPSAFSTGGRALVVLDEIGTHGEGELRQLVLDEMRGFAITLHDLLTPMLPHLDEWQLRARLRFISGAVLGPPPRSHGAPELPDGRALDAMEFLLPFARAALS